MVHEIRKADEHGRESDQAVQDGDELRHLCHADAVRERQTNPAADQQSTEETRVVLSHGAGNGRAGWNGDSDIGRV